SQRDSKVRPQLWASISLAQKVWSAARSLASSCPLRTDTSCRLRLEAVESSSGKMPRPTHTNSSVIPNRASPNTDHKSFLAACFTRQTSAPSHPNPVAQTCSLPYRRLAVCRLDELDASQPFLTR